MDTTILILLGLVALGSVVQIVSLVGLGRTLTSASHRLTDLGARVLTTLRPTVAQLSRASDRAARSSALFARESEQLGAALEGAAVRLDRAQQRLADLIVPTATRAGSLFAAARFVRRGLRLYRRFFG
jgi:hypothetical protein